MKKILLALVCSLTVYASSITVSDAYVRATPPGLPNSAGFMTITNNSNKDLAIVSAKSTVSNVAELHTHDMKDGMMKMYQVPKIDVKAKQSVVLKPGGFHVMLLGLKQKPLKVGQSVDITLVLSNKEEITIKAPVKTVMGGMKKHSMKKQMSCGQGKCGSN